jgi:RNA polymerase sigma-70 factor (ECF subfamily)
MEGVRRGVNQSAGMGDVDEGQLLRRIARGDRGAFDEFYRRTAPWLAVRLRRRCADDDIVAEVMQESYLAVWQAASSYVGLSDPSAGGGSAGGWLWTIASRRLIDAFRRRARQREALIAEPARSEPAAEDEVLGGIPDAALTAALARLGPELHAVLQLMVLDGLTARETAGLLGVPEATVRTRVRRARLHLRRALS